MTTTGEVCHDFFSVSTASTQNKKIIDNLCDILSKNKQKYPIQYCILASSLRRESKNTSNFNELVDLLEIVLRNNSTVNSDNRWDNIAQSFYITEILLNIAFEKVTPARQNDLKRKYEDILAEFIQEKYDLKTSDWKALYQTTELCNFLVGTGGIVLLYFLAYKLCQ